MVPPVKNYFRRIFLCQFFVSTTEGGYQLTTAGYVAAAVILIALIVLATVLAKKEKKEKKKMGTKQLVFCAMAVALAMVTSMLRFILSHLAVLLHCSACCSSVFVGYVGNSGPWQTREIFEQELSYGVLQFIIEPYIYFPLQVLVDYPLAFGALGLSGVFAESKHGLVKGYLLGVFGRYVFAVISGWIFFGEYAWDGWGALPYSFGI